MSSFQAATASDIITDAMIEALGISVGEPIAADEMAFGLRTLNRMMGMYSIIRSFCYDLSAPVYAFNAVKNNWTIGPIGADFTGPRPTRVLSARLIVTGTSPLIYLPIDVIEEDEWNMLTVRAIPTAIPSRLFYDSGYTSVGLTAGVPNPGYGTLWFYGQPRSGYQVELTIPLQLTNFTALSGAGAYFIFPPGAEEWIVTTLAERLSTSYRRPISQDLKDRARKARAAWVALNSKSPVSASDYPGGGRGGDGWNWLSGGFGRG